LFSKIHESNWGEDVAISRYFTLQKEKADILNYSSGKQFHLIYYDAFAPDVQPELWTRTIFENLFLMLRPNGILVTYCSKGDVRRAMMAAGFAVKKLHGPPGKREMLRATKSG
jgi:tRNA U34 5-methylaminomethyl-2-thiouridine-forming methyltransferase MnmC